MILYIETMSGYRSQFRLSSINDFNPLIEMFPRIQDIISESSSLKEAAHEVAVYISSSNLDAWVDESSALTKGIKDKAVALGLAAMTMLPHASTSSDQQTPSLMPGVTTAYTAAHNRVIPNKELPFGKHPMDRFLWATMQHESSGGANQNHKPIKSGPHKGEIAIGRFAFLKSTIDEFVNRRRISGTLTPEYAAMDKMDRDRAANYLKLNPHMELSLGRQAAEHIINRQGGDIHRSSYCWLGGHNLSPHRIKEEDLYGTSDRGIYSRKVLNSYNQAPSRLRIKQPKPKMIASVSKNEAIPLKQKLKDWIKYREEKSYPKMVQSNDMPDMGSVRDKELDRVPFDDKSNPIKYLQEKILEAKNNRKP